MLDAQPGTAETNTLTGNVVLWNNNPWIGVDGAEDKLVLGGTGMVSSSELTYVWFASQPTNPWSLTYSGQTANLAADRHRRRGADRAGGPLHDRPGQRRAWTQGPNAYSYIILYTGRLAGGDRTDMTAAGTPAPTLNIWRGSAQNLTKAGPGTLELGGTDAQQLHRHDDRGRRHAAAEQDGRRRRQRGADDRLQRSRSPAGPTR